MGLGKGLNMKLNRYIKELQALKKIHGDIDLVYASDDEGNGFQILYYSPSTGQFADGDFDDKGEINAICIN